ncbi:MAG TPA: hypothetical protein VN493_30720 [Thermoanaerobaculia bacterium]|nr:hypothetical protein [Thermoanaerobaculia bacterium]
MGLGFRDLVMDVAVECMPGGPPPGPCGCTQTANAPQCQQKSNKPGGHCPQASAKIRPPKRSLADLEALRSQLRAELTTSG